MTDVIEHLPGYQQRDYRIVDYHMYCHETTKLWFRGPEPGILQPHQYFVCIGAAQTFGCFCKSPFPELISREIQLPGVNLGYGGAGPSFFLKHPYLLEYINKAKFVIVQVMSGRSESNSLFESGGLEYLTRRQDGNKLGADAAYKEILAGSPFWKQFPIGKRYAKRLSNLLGRGHVKKIVEETRSNWVKNYQDLMSQITIPKILFWFSKRSPNYQEKYHSLGAMFNEFPQLVNMQMIQDIEKFSDDYIECISRKGSPQPLISRFTGEATTIDPAFDRQDLGGKIWTHNSYYPTPEMHDDAAKILIPTLRKYI